MSFLIAFFLLQYDADRIDRLSKRLIDGITSKVNHVVRNGDPNATYPGTDFENGE
jgi:cysteine desulfurase